MATETADFLDVLIVDPNNVLYEGKGTRIFAPGKVEEVAFLPQHTPLYTELTAGKVKIEEVNGKKVEHKIDGGIARVANNTLKIMVGF